MTWITIDVKPYHEKLNEIEREAKKQGYSMVTLHIVELKDGSLLVEYDVFKAIPLAAYIDREASLNYMQHDKLTTMETAVLNKQFDDFASGRVDHKHEWLYTTTAKCKNCGSGYIIAKDVDKFNPVD